VSKSEGDNVEVSKRKREQADSGHMCERMTRSKTRVNDGMHSFNT
jgi:hypothetical protein